MLPGPWASLMPLFGKIMPKLCHQNFFNAKYYANAELCWFSRNFYNFYQVLQNFRTNWHFFCQIILKLYKALVNFINQFRFCPPKMWKTHENGHENRAKREKIFNLYNIFSKMTLFWGLCQLCHKKFSMPHYAKIFHYANWNFIMPKKPKLALNYATWQHWY